MEINVLYPTKLRPGSNPKFFFFLHAQPDGITPASVRCWMKLWSAVGTAAECLSGGTPTGQGNRWPRWPRAVRVWTAESVHWSRAANQQQPDPDENGLPLGLAPRLL